MNATELAADLRELVASEGTAFTWTSNGVINEYRGIFSARTERNDLEIGGFVGSFDATLYCVLDDLTNGPPPIGAKVRAKARWWRVVARDQDDELVGTNFYLETADK